MLEPLIRVENSEDGKVGRRSKLPYHDGRQNARLDKTTRTLHGIGKGQQSHTVKLKKETQKPQLPSTPDAAHEIPQYAPTKTKGKKPIKEYCLTFECVVDDVLIKIRSKSTS